MVMYASISGVQKEIGSLYAGIGGTSKELNNVYAGIGGVSKEIYSAVQAQPLSALSVGSLVKLNETVSGMTTAVPFLVLAHGHHATGKTTMMRKELWGTTMKYDAGTDSNYSGSDIDLWLSNTYKSYLDADIQSQLASANIIITYYQISRSIFLLSGTEVGYSKDGMATEGTAIPYFSSDALRIAKLSGVANGWWLRSSFGYAENYAWMVGADGKSSSNRIYNLFGVRPAFCLPSTLEVSSSVDGDGCYTLI